MQVNIVCDDGFKAKFAITATTTAKQIFEEVRAARQNTGHDHEDLQIPSIISVAYQVNQSNANNLEFLSSEVPLITVVPTTTVGSSNGNSHHKTIPHFHLFGFKAMRKVSAVADMKKLAGNITGLAHQLTNALDSLSKNDLEHAQSLAAAAVAVAGSSSISIDLTGSSTVVEHRPTSSNVNLPVTTTVVVAESNGSAAPSVTSTSSSSVVAPQITLDPSSMTQKSVTEDINTLTTTFIRQSYALLTTALESNQVTLTKTARDKLTKVKGKVLIDRIVCVF